MSSIEDSYPNITRWVRDFGWIEIGQNDFSQSMVRVLDIGGMVWESESLYATLDTSLQDAEEAVAEWFRKEMREEAGLAKSRRKSEAL